MSVFWPGGGLNPYLIITTIHKRGEACGAGNSRIKSLSQELEMAAPPGHGTWNVEREAEP